VLNGYFHSLLLALLLSGWYLPYSQAHASDGVEASSGADESAKPAKPTKVYQYRVGNTLTFSDIPPRKGPYIVWRPSCFACSLTSNIDWHTMRLNMKAFTPFIESAAQQHQVDPALVRAVIHAESNFNPRARSNKGASGLMQLMPGTAHAVGVQDVWAPESNIFGGTSYLSGLLKRFGGNIDFAVAAYNAGPGAVDKYAGIPPYAETKVYVQRVRILYQRYREQR
jgi:soluble lytic murein transglycosylase-like protein